MFIGGIYMKKQKRYIIISRFRFTMFILFLIIFSNLLLSFIFKPNKGFTSTMEEEIIDVIIIKDGDNLWNIAKNYNKNSKDIRKDVYKIKEFNNLSNYNIKKGQVLYIPKLK